MPRLERVQSEVEHYCAAVEDWKSEHDDAMACLDLEYFLQVGIALYDFIDRLDEEWRLSVVRGKAVSDPNIVRQFDELFDAWLQPCARVESRIQALEAREYVVKHADEFRFRHARAQSVSEEGQPQAQ